MQLFLLVSSSLYENFAISILVFLQLLNFLIYVAFSLIHQIHVIQIIQPNINTISTQLIYTTPFVIDCFNPLS